MGQCFLPKDNLTLFVRILKSGQSAFIDLSTDIFTNKTKKSCLEIIVQWNNAVCTKVTWH